MKNIFIILFCLGAFNLSSQTDNFYTVYLNNGSIIHGVIIDLNTDGNINVITESDNSWVFDMKTEVKRVVKAKRVEQTKTIPTQNNTYRSAPVHPKSKYITRYDRKLQKRTFDSPNTSGFYGNVNMGMMGGRTNFGSTINTNFQIGVGYRFNEKYMLHFGTGLEFIEHFSFPFFIEGRRNLKFGKISTYASVSAGINSYTRGWEWGAQRRSSGEHFSIGYGLKKYFTINNAIDFRIEYRVQTRRDQFTTSQWEPEGTTTTSSWEVNNLLNRFGFRIGHIF